MTPSTAQNAESRTQSAISVTWTLNVQLSSKASHTRVVEMDADETTQLHKLKLLKEMPDEIGDLAADAVDNLRSALDQTGYAAAFVAKQPRLKKTAFPFGETTEDVENAIGGWSKDIPGEISDFFRKFEPYKGEPYKGGKGGLWALNQLCVGNKHTVIFPIGTAMGLCSSPGPAYSKRPRKAGLL